MATQLTAKEAYCESLESMRTKLSLLRNQLDALTGDGTLSDEIHWAHVGDLNRLNELLDQALDVHPTRFPLHR